MTTLDEILDAMPADDRERVEARAKDLLHAENLRELRRAQKLTQAEIARRLGKKQHDVSKIEKRADMLVSTMRSYVRSAGGELVLMARMPGGDMVELTGFGTPVAGRSAAPEQDDTDASRPAKARA